MFLLIEPNTKQVDLKDILMSTSFLILIIIIPLSQ